MFVMLNLEAGQLPISYPAGQERFGELVEREGIRTGSVYGEDLVGGGGAMGGASRPGLGGRAKGGACAGLREAAAKGKGDTGAAEG